MGRDFGSKGEQDAADESVDLWNDYIDDGETYDITKEKKDGR